MSTPHRFVSGAIDLGEVKARAEARQQAHAAGPASQHIPHSIEVTMDNLENEVLRRSTQVPVIVLIGTSRSEDSEQLKADFTAMAARSELAFIFGYIDADTHPEVAQVFGVQGLPTTIAVAAGRPVADFEGGQPAAALQQWVNSVIKAVSSQLTGLPQQQDEQPEDPRLDAATEALNAGDFATAIQVYDDILAVEPKNTDVQQAHDTALLLQRLAAIAPGTGVTAAADADPLNVDKAFVAADASITAGEPEAAFDRLITLLQTVSSPRKQP